MAVTVNGKPAGTGKPGSYVTLDRAWAEGDVASFTLPAGLVCITIYGSGSNPRS